MQNPLSPTFGYRHFWREHFVSPSQTAGTLVKYFHLGIFYDDFSTSAPRQNYMGGHLLNFHTIQSLAPGASNQIMCCSVYLLGARHGFAIWDLSSIFFQTAFLLWALPPGLSNANELTYLMISPWKLVCHFGNKEACMGGSALIKPSRTNCLSLIDGSKSIMAYRKIVFSLHHWAATSCPPARISDYLWWGVFR